MEGTGRNHTVQGNPDTERQRSYVLIHKWILYISQMVTSLQSMTPENPESKEDPKRDIHGLRDNQKSTRSPL